MRLQLPSVARGLNFGQFFLQVPALCVQAAKSQMRLHGCLAGCIGDKYQNHTSWLIYIAKKAHLIEIGLLSFGWNKNSFEFWFNLISTFVIK